MTYTIQVVIINEGGRVMPLFEVCCAKCGHEFELFQKFSSTESAACPLCGGETERKVSKSSFVLSGAGWAKDNYAGAGGSK